MKPIVNKNSMATVPKAAQKRICSCEKPCTYFLTVTTMKGEGLVLCETDAEEYALGILNRIGVSMPDHIAVHRGGWTVRQEQALIDYMKTRGLNEDGTAKYGVFTTLAKAFGKTREQVKNKVNKLRQDGRL